MKLKKGFTLLEMIIVYGYFIRNMENIIKIKFILPLNLGYEILEMAKRHFGCTDSLTFKGIELENQDYNWNKTNINTNK